MAITAIDEDDQYMLELKIILDCLWLAGRPTPNHSRCHALNIQLLIARYPRLAPEAQQRAIWSMWNCLGQITNTKINAATTRLIQAIL